VSLLPSWPHQYGADEAQERRSQLKVRLHPIPPAIRCLTILGLLVLAAAAAEGPRGQAGPSGQEIQVPPPPFTEGIFPCSDCHKDLPVNRQRRELTEMHDDIVLDHGPRTRWCFDCHNPDDRDKLRLASGELIDFSHSYELCGQCHGDKYRDWRAGVHGKRTGMWNGRKEYLQCVNCHNPHKPHFAPLKPMPPPVPPAKIRASKGGRP
jgi:hypothetical protein